jgi:hypothetical protein
MNSRKLLQRVSRGAVQNVPFDDFLRLVQAFGFRLDRVRGSHHILIHPMVPELINLQEYDGEAKPYQIRQFLRLVLQYNLRLEA